MHGKRLNPSSTGRRMRLGMLCLALMGLLQASAAPPAWADHATTTTMAGYDAAEAGHPVKIIYYVLYPVGFVLNTLILKPVWWLGEHEPFRTVFGTEMQSSL